MKAIAASPLTVSKTNHVIRLLVKQCNVCALGNANTRGFFTIDAINVFYSFYSGHVFLRF